jgi:hypothetical protein
VAEFADLVYGVLVVISHNRTRSDGNRSYVVFVAVLGVIRCESLFVIEIVVIFVVVVYLWPYNS